MASNAFSASLTRRSHAVDPAVLARHFGDHEDLLALWMAEPYVALAPTIVSALEARAGTAWYGYEVRPSEVLESFWSWTMSRHGWDSSALETSVSPSVGTSIAVLLSQLTGPCDGVIIQPPVFTDFKPLIASAGREVVRNPLLLTDDGYVMDLDGLADIAAEPPVRALILCNPHNPVGRVWRREELTAVAETCARNDVFVIADEIHADLSLPPFEWTPFAVAAGAVAGPGVSWAAAHGPIKTFGLAGVCDTLLLTDNQEVAEEFESLSSQFHLSRNNVFGLAAFETAYDTGTDWLDGLLRLVAANAALLRERLPDGIDLVEPEGTYLAWLDFRALDMDVPALADWLASSARLALSPGHWFGREGAGFARMTLAAPTEQVEEAVRRLGHALSPA